MSPNIEEFIMLMYIYISHLAYIPTCIKVNLIDLFSQHITMLILIDISCNINE